jgi:hypothetical protein
MHPYDQLMKDVRSRTPFARRVIVGYPHFFTAQGATKTPLTDRCNGVKKADQRWIVEKIDETDEIIKRHAAKNGFLFADPRSRFNTHELCGSGADWFYGLGLGLGAGKFHPNPHGHQALEESIKDVMSDAGLTFQVRRPITRSS